MDSFALILTLLAVCLVGVTFHARHLGNDRRDVALLGVFSGLMGLAAATTAML